VTIEPSADLSLLDPAPAVQPTLWPVRTAQAISFVDERIFTLTFFGECMGCSFCKDSCCQYGCDVDLSERDRILAVKEELAPDIAAPVAQWFLPEVYEDPEYPTGKYVRSSTVNGACVFRSVSGRGCGLHRLALQSGRDYHQLKPMVCWMFPVCWDKGVLRPNYDVTDDLVCEGTGTVLYDASRSEIRHVFGESFVLELDAVRARVALGERP
jgi:hypothetical protein